MLQKKSCLFTEAANFHRPKSGRDRLVDRDRLFGHFWRSRYSYSLGSVWSGNWIPVGAR